MRLQPPSVTATWLAKLLFHRYRIRPCGVRVWIDMKNAPPSLRGILNLWPHTCQANITSTTGGIWGVPFKGIYKEKNPAKSGLTQF